MSELTGTMTETQGLVGNLSASYGTKGVDGVSVEHEWNGTVLTVTSKSGTSSADLKGDKGDKGDVGEKGDKGDKGNTGVSPTVEVTEENGVATLSITDANGSKTAILDVVSKANAIVQTAQGKAIAVKDSAYSHLRGLNVSESTNVSIYGKNICSAKLSIGTENVVIADFGKDVTFDALTFSIELVEATVLKVGSAFINFRKNDGTNQYVVLSDIGLSANTPYSKKIKTTKSNITCRQIICYFKSNDYGLWSGEVKNAQLELGKDATEYEEYKEKQTLYISPEDEIYKTLHANYPNTTVLNDSGAYMELSYNADTKLYIDNKIAELVK